MFRENETKSNKKDKIQKYFNQKGFLPVKSNFKCPYLHSEDINIQKKVHTKNGRPQMAQWHLKSIRGNWGYRLGSISGVPGPFRGFWRAPKSNLCHFWAIFDLPCQSLKLLWSHKIACTRAPHNGSGSWEPD